jgi:hypothetical protein
MASAGIAMDRVQAKRRAPSSTGTLIVQVAIPPSSRICVTCVQVVVDAQGRSLRFRVTRIASYPPQEAPVQDIFGTTGGFYLNLIICAGTWIPAQHQTTLRLVVYNVMEKEKPGRCCKITGRHFPCFWRCFPASSLAPIALLSWVDLKAAVVVYRPV